MIASSARALQVLLAHYNKFASDCDILYNSKKSVCMSVKPAYFKSITDPTMYLSNCTLKYVAKYKYLGVIICDTMKDDDEIGKQCRNLYARGNTVIRNFKNCSDVKCLLLRSYCTSFYCCLLWSDFSKESLRRIKVAYNRIFRVLLNLERRLSMSSAFVCRGLDAFIVALRKSILSLKQRLLVSSNSIINTITDSLYFMSCSTTSYWNNSLYMLKASL